MQDIPHMDYGLNGIVHTVYSIWTFECTNGTFISSNDVAAVCKQETP